MTAMDDKPHRYEADDITANKQQPQQQQQQQQQQIPSCLAVAASEVQ
jgi:hypothetical protein